MCGSVRFGLLFSLMIEMLYHYFENLDEVSAVREAENEKLLIRPLEDSSELLIVVLFMYCLPHI